MLYKYDKLVSHSTEFTCTTKCNLNCRGCLNFNNRIKNPRDADFEDFKRHLDILFEKYDYMYSFHFSGGEPLLCKALPKMLEYLVDNYGRRIFKTFIITNGVKIPSDELLRVVKKIQSSMLFYFFVDDYSASSPTIDKSLPALKKVLESHAIPYSVHSPFVWYDLDVGGVDYSASSEDELIKHRDSCQTGQGCENGYLFGCCYVKYAAEAGIWKSTPKDMLDIRSATKVELLEYRYGHSEQGYFDMCKYCNGFGDRRKLMAPAEQLPSGRRRS
jgi:hypothetical protein